MKFGIREVCDVTFTKIAGNGPKEFTIDTAKMSTIESTTSTSYAQGGKGNSRLIAWESEKTLTFTIEDALMSLASFQALTGADVKTDSVEKTIEYSIRTTSFAGYYSITATTLFRDEEGKDHLSTIYIPKAKLQTSLNLSMSPSGDPSSFNFTFDALPRDREDNLLFTLTINEMDENDIIDINNNVNRRVSATIWHQQHGTKVGLDRVWDQTGSVSLTIMGKEVVESVYNSIQGGANSTTKTVYALLANEEELYSGFSLDTDLLIDKTIIFPVRNAKYLTALSETPGITYNISGTTLTGITIPEDLQTQSNLIINIPSTVTEIGTTFNKDALTNYHIAMKAGVKFTSLKCQSLIFYGSPAEWEAIKDKVEFSSGETERGVTIQAIYNTNLITLTTGHHEIIILAEENDLKTTTLQITGCQDGELLDETPLIQLPISGTPTTITITAAEEQGIMTTIDANGAVVITKFDASVIFDTEWTMDAAVFFTGIVDKSDKVTQYAADLSGDKGFSITVSNLATNDYNNTPFTIGLETGKEEPI